MCGAWVVMLCVVPVAVDLRAVPVFGCFISIALNWSLRHVDRDCLLLGIAFGGVAAMRFFSFV